ncbi:MAG: UGSC family (seleno)protein [Pseudomonadota bacterium]
MAMIQVYRPVHTDPKLPPAPLAPRRHLAGGARIALINNGKPKTTDLLGYIAEAFGRIHPVASVTLHSKPSAGSPLDVPTADRIAAESDFVIAGLGDCGACSSCSLIDAVMMEERGIPGAVVITDPFVDVCARLSDRLGYAGYRPIMIPHPAASRSDEWLRGWADRSVAVLVSQVLPEGSA